MPAWAAQRQRRSRCSPTKAAPAAAASTPKRPADASRPGYSWPTAGCPPAEKAKMTTTMSEDQRNRGGGTQDDARQEAQWPHPQVPSGA